MEYASATWPTNAAAIYPARLSISRKAGVESAEKEAVALIAKDRIGEIDVTRCLMELVHEPRQHGACWNRSATCDNNKDTDCMLCAHVCVCILCLWCKRRVFAASAFLV